MEYLQSVQKIFQDQLFSVPDYQRGYAWEKQQWQDLLDDLEILNIDQEHYWPAKNFFKAYIVDDQVRDIVKRNQPADFYNCPSFDFEDYQKLNGYKTTVPQYIHDYAYYLTNL
jgi:hypothetical protein